MKSKAIPTIARADEVLLDSNDASYRPKVRRKRRARAPKAAPLAVPQQESRAGRQQIALNAVLLGAAAILVGGLVLRLTARRKHDPVDSALRGLAALATAWTS